MKNSLPIIETFVRDIYCHYRFPLYIIQRQTNNFLGIFSVSNYNSSISITVCYLFIIVRRPCVPNLFLTIPSKSERSFSHSYSASHTPKHFCIRMDQCIINMAASLMWTCRAAVNVIRRVPRGNNTALYISELLHQTRQVTCVAPR